ncbi:Ser/Thr protein kinase RdoA involved in Cpx stress response, MazF antagonist [Luteibacter sp. UNCMF331Sha3.1]|uniref:phosphotransferase enzyme family protein n=1 Tax=Luteibacter sp. UNCMF331Sha3.1 TaxID=1502760 RepID=UPI0008D7454E|nr:phosphotransferase [Luteibacter sp. UNCMF331Sha3.1]SEN42844.1 Ser/Thr protein kinase RdoA involved in Cpx stress response, MazF antagonist [Luteibacter sp. UNCMF331Sha3.1]
MIDDAHLTHGLAGDELAPDWPALTHDEVAPILARIPLLGAFRSLDWLSPRPLSAAALATTDAGPVFIKRHHRRVRDEITLGEEHRFARHLRDRGIPVPRILTDAHGASVFGTDAWVYEVHDAARGVDVYREAYSWSPIGGVRHAHRVGAMLARMHDATVDHHAPQRSTHILVARADILSAHDPVDVLDAQLAARPALARYLAERDWQRDMTSILSASHARIARDLAAQPALWTHGDLHVSNLCWSDAGDDATITDVLDVGLSAKTFALFDLATAIERNAIAWLDIERGDIGRHDIARGLIDGYRAIRPLHAADLALLADLLPLVHIDFALSEVEYFEGVTGRRDHADVAYHTFLIGHARWFATRHGRAFLGGNVFQ